MGEDPANMNNPSLASLLFSAVWSKPKSSIPASRLLLLWESNHNDKLTALLTVADLWSKHPDLRASHTKVFVQALYHNRCTTRLSSEGFHESLLPTVLTRCQPASFTVTPPVSLGGKVTDWRAHAAVCPVDSEFFSQRLLAPEEAAEEETNSTKVFVAVPSLWGRDVVPKIEAGSQVPFRRADRENNTAALVVFPSQPWDDC